MATSMMHCFRFGSSKEYAPVVKEKPVRTLPAQWYTSPEIYELKRRAIFSKRWLFITHRARVKKTDDWLRFEIAGFDFIITRDRQGGITAFHHICQHRTYPGLNGKMAKVPGYQDVDGFDKEQNGLFRIHVKVDINGFIWERYKAYNFDDYDLNHTYELDGHYNWKILADNFNYHCPTTHANIPFLNLESFDSDLKDGHIQHHCVSTPEQLAKGLFTVSAYYFPVTAMFVSDMYERVMREYKVSCTDAQRDLERGVFVNSQLHLKYEKD
ncbi:uncharacterized protein N7477_004646 [Penicillium maclennaniae]|uniref:uncharacterized protein n=1 Tax=Penicillium maclennaniae TaxID=1343394 RepID=UPI00254241BA|nr:uncharacterized protein N7477_004646 [Penicillium maclennaniae]KAJ5674712.1 hypothetical protein N7477_004646 [Penicillium maclennaniae]